MPFMDTPLQSAPVPETPSETEDKPPQMPEKLRLEPTRYGDWELNGKCVDF